MSIISKGIALLSMSAMLMFTACERDDKQTVTVGGKGGNATLKVTPQHHGDNIDSCTIYIKYNAQDKPSTYDEEVKCVMENGRPVATFTNLNKGNYYIFGKGWDPGIEQEVEGGIPYTITEETTKEITVPVTETGH